MELWNSRSWQQLKKERKHFNVNETNTNIKKHWSNRGIKWHWPEPMHFFGCRVSRAPFYLIKQFFLFSKLKPMHEFDIPWAKNVRALKGWWYMSVCEWFGEEGKQSRMKIEIRECCRMKRSFQDWNMRRMKVRWRCDFTQRNVENEKW